MKKFTYNKNVNPTLLTKEIQASSISAALDYISTYGNMVDVFFKTDLINNDEDILNEIIEDHQNIPDVDNNKMEDGRERVYNSPRPFGMRVVYTGNGDNIANNYDIGHGNLFLCKHSIGDSSIGSIYCDFNTIENPTYIFNALAMYEGMNFDKLSLLAVPRLTKYGLGSNTNYNLVGGYLVVPAAGNGNISIQDSDIQLVQVLQKEDGTYPPGYWDADYNEITHQFENFRSCPLGDGDYNIFTYEVPLAVVTKNMMLRGTTNDFTHPPCFEIDRIGHGTRIKISVETTLPDHDWTIGVTLMLYRKKTS